MSVKAVPNDSVNKVMVDIEADLWAQPYPERLYLKTELDVDLACIRLVDQGAS